MSRKSAGYEVGVNNEQVSGQRRGTKKCRYRSQEGSGADLGPSGATRACEESKWEQLHALLALPVLAPRFFSFLGNGHKPVSLMQLRRPPPDFPMAFGPCQNVFYIRVSLDYSLLIADT